MDIQDTQICPVLVCLCRTIENRKELEGVEKKRRQDEKKHILHEERPGHSVSRGVCMVKECVEEREKGVT